MQAGERTGAPHARFRDALAVPGAGLPALASLLARLPITMGSIALLVYVERATGSFADAGFVGGSQLVGAAIGAVVQGRAVDRFGAARALPVVTVLFAVVTAGVFTAIESGAPIGLVALSAVGFGVTAPAIATASRALWGRLIPPGPVRDAGYTYEAVSLETFFILGPAVAGLLASLPWAGTALAVAASLFVVGTLTFVATPAVRAWRSGSAAGGRAPLLRVVRLPGMRTVFALVGGFACTIGFLEVGLPAFATERGARELGGVLLGALSITSVAFGLLYARRPWPARLSLRGPALVSGFGALVALLALPQEFVGMTIAVLVAGTLVTPQATLHSLLIERVSPQDAAAEAFGWLLTAVTLGIAVGQSVGGQLVELIGPSATFAVAGVPAVLGGLVALLLRPSLERVMATDRPADGESEAARPRQESNLRPRD